MLNYLGYVKSKKFKAGIFRAEICNFSVVGLQFF